MCFFVCLFVCFFVCFFFFVLFCFVCVFFFFFFCLIMNKICLLYLQPDGISSKLLYVRFRREKKRQKRRHWKCKILILL